MPTDIELKIGLSDSDKAAMQAAVAALIKASLITPYSTSATYAVGDFVYYSGDGKIYKCTTAISTAEAWTSGHWAEATLNDIIDAVNVAVASVNNKVEPDDICPELRAGYAFTADNLNATKGLTVNDDPMSYGIVGGAQKSAVGDGNASLNKLVCVDVVKNQLAYETDTNEYGSSAKCTYSYDSTTHTGKYTFTGQTTQFYAARTSASILPVTGHIYLYGFGKTKFNLTNSGSFSAWRLYVRRDDNHSALSRELSIDNSVKSILKFVTTSGNDYVASKLYLFWPYGNAVTFEEGDTIELAEPICIDLTQYFGSNEVVNAIIGTGTDDEKLARLLAFDPEILNDTSYDAGTMVPSKTAKLLPIGVNQWDEEWEQGIFNTITGEDINVGYKSQIRTKSPLPVLSETDYFCACEASDSNAAIWAMFYDALGNVVDLSGSTYSPKVNNCFNIANRTFKTPANAVSMKFYCNVSYGTVYNHDICINISNVSLNGQYKPHKRTIVTLPNYEGHGILKVVDGKVVADGTELYPDGNSKKRYGTYTFTGNETWYSYGSGYQAELLTGNEYVNVDGGASVPQNVLSDSSIPFGSRNQVSSGENVISLSGNKIFAGSTSGLTGKTIVYELATEEDVTTPVYQSTFPVEQGCTLQFLDEDDNPIAGLQGSEIFYQKNIKAFTEAFGEAIDWDPARIERLANLSFTPEYDDILLSPTPVGAYARAQVYNATFTIVISASFSGTANGSVTMQDSVIDLSTEFPNTKPAEKIIDADGKPASEAPTTPDCPIAYFVGRTKDGTLRWCLLHSAANEIKVHFEETVPLDASGNGIIDCRASLIL